MTPDIREYFRVLELSPGASLDEIKGAYRRLLNQWHPDRFKPGSVMQTTAEDITKELNEAYHQLCRKKRYLEFRRARSARPAESSRSPWTPPRHRAHEAYAQASRASRPPPAPPAPPSSPRRPPFRSEAGAAAPQPPVAEAPSSKPAGRPRRRVWRWTALVIGLAGGSIFALRFLESRQDTRVPTIARTAASRWTTAAPATHAVGQVSDLTAKPQSGQVKDLTYERASTLRAPVESFASSRAEIAMPVSAALPSMNAEWQPRTESFSRRIFGASNADSAAAVNEALSSLDTFGTGDTLARVLSLQGVPDEANDRVFRYGSSLIYFAGGRVVAWRDGWPRLRIFALPRFVFGGLGTFGLGATRSEVVHVQGTPTAVGDSIYFYGNSVVFFDREWVSGWREIDEPLRVRAWPVPPASLMPARVD